MSFRCEKCGGEFDSRAQLEAHARDEHGVVASGGHICAACGAEFGSREELDLHAKADHAA